MNKLKSLLNKPWSSYTIATCSAVLLYLFLTHLGMFSALFGKIAELLSPVLIGGAIAYLLNPVVNFFEKKVFSKIKKASARHTLAVIVTLLIILICLGVLLATLIPSLISSVSALISNRELYIETLETLAAKFSDRFIKLDVTRISQEAKNLVDRFASNAFDNMGSILTTLKGVGTGFSNFAFGFVFAICFLLGKDSLIRVTQRFRRSYMSTQRFEQLNRFWSRCHSIFTRYLSCTILDGLVVGIANAIFMLIAKIPYVALISVVVGVTNLIPTFGPVIGAVIGAFILFLAKPVYALYFLIFTVIIQSVDGMIIKPKLFSGSLGIPAIWTVVVLTVGGKFGGILGIFLSIPVATILLILYKESLVPRLEERKERINTKKKDGETSEEASESEEIVGDGNEAKEKASE